MDEVIEAAISAMKPHLTKQCGVVIITFEGIGIGLRINAGVHGGEKQVIGQLLQVIGKKWEAEG